MSTKGILYKRALFAGTFKKGSRAKVKDEGPSDYNGRVGNVLSRRDTRNDMNVVLLDGSDMPESLRNLELEELKK